MKIAIDLAKKNFGKTFPNPSVGCVIVECDNNYNNDKIISYGQTQISGRPHAEAVALLRANFKKKKKYICYSTLEPCSHDGRSESCVNLIKKYPISEVVFSLIDPDKRVKGNGKKSLEMSNLKVRNGVMKEETIKVYEGYFFNKLFNRPKVTLKIATSIDGKIAYSDGKSKWISNKKSRKIVHQKRFYNDAILVGSKTLLLDNPTLDTRIEGLREFSPIKVFINRNLTLPLNLNVFNKNKQKTFIVTTKKKMSERKKLFKKKGIEIIEIEKKNFTFINILKEISKLNISSLFVEGGSVINSFFLSNNLVDDLIIFRGNFFIGSKGIDLANDDFNFLNIKNSFKLNYVHKIENNVLEMYRNKKNKSLITKILKDF